MPVMPMVQRPAHVFRVLAPRRALTVLRSAATVMTVAAVVAAKLGCRLLCVRVAVSGRGIRVLGGLRAVPTGIVRRGALAAFARGHWPRSVLARRLVHEG